MNLVELYYFVSTVNVMIRGSFLISLFYMLIFLCAILLYYYKQIMSRVLIEVI